MGQPNQKLAAQLQQQPNGAAQKGSATPSREPPQKTPPPPPNGNNTLNLGDHMIYSNDMKPVIIDDFEMLKVIGRGQFAKVVQVRKKDNQKVYAMKILNKAKLAQTDQLEHIKTERAVLQFIEHPFLVKLYYAFQTVDKLYMVMDFVNGGELFFHLKREKRFAENRAKFYAAELLLALEHVHKHNIVYRDLKPENILMDREGHVCLTDFGLAKILSSQDRTHTFCGTPEYLAPEVLLQKGHGKPVDWWSFGTLLYEMMIGIPPFYCENVQEMYDAILHSEIALPDNFLSMEAQDILYRLLERDPEKRLGTKGADEVKKHPFFKDIDWALLLQKKVAAPFKPQIVSDMDTSCFDDEFLSQPINDSFDNGNEHLGESVQKEFEGFTYTGQSKLKAADQMISAQSG